MQLLKNHGEEELIRSGFKNILSEKSQGQKSIYSMLYLVYKRRNNKIHTYEGKHSKHKPETSEDRWECLP